MKSEDDKNKNKNRASRIKACYIVGVLVQVTFDIFWYLRYLPRVRGGEGGKVRRYFNNKVRVRST